MAQHDMAEVGRASSPDIGDGPRRMAKADLPKAEFADWRGPIGHAIERTRLGAELSLKQFADAIGRDERQVARWIAGTERPQFDAIFAVPMFRTLFLIALAKLTENVDVVTTITVRRV